MKNLNNFIASNIVLSKNYKIGIKPIYNLKEINDSIIYKAINNILNDDINLGETLPNYILKKEIYQIF